MGDYLLLPLLLVPAVLAVTVHEIAHGWVALQLGDDTAANAGRLSFNPLRHVDPVGTLLVPASLYAVGELLLGSAIFFGWARPVPVQWRHLTPLRGGIAAVAIAGPGSNLLMLGAWALVALFARHLGLAHPALIYMCQAGIIFNAAIMMINLVPVPPLDGSRIVTALLPAGWAARYNRFEMMGLLLMLLLLVTGVLEGLLGPLFEGVTRLSSALGIRS